MFDKIIGNEKIKKYLEDTIKNKNYSHSYMFVGKSGIGKKLFARQYAKNIMCLNESVHEDSCDSCIKFNANSNPDYYEIIPDGKSIKVDQIRKMQEKIAEKPIISNRKVYIIDDADLMTEESQNSLLKTLEEPPVYAVLILVVSNENRILQTIKSRCIKIKFNDLTNDELKLKLPNISDEILELLEGSLEKADTVDKKKSDYEALTKIINILQKGNLLEAFNNAELLYNRKDDIIDLLNYMNIILFDKKMLNAIQIVEQTKKKILANNNYEMSIDYLLMNIVDTIDR